MIYITQILYVKEGKEDVFEEFESNVIPFMEKYGGEMICRLRPGKTTFIGATEIHPYEIHIMSFKSEAHLNNYIQDEGRKRFMHLKEESVASQLLVKGKEMV